VIWSVGGLLSLWNLSPNRANLWILAIQPLLVAIPAFAMIPIARAMKLGRPQIGVLAIAAGVSNSGFTLGAFLCYALLPTPSLLTPMVQAGSDAQTLAVNALAYGVLSVMAMSAASVLMLFPLAHRFGEHHRSDQPLGRLILKSFADWKATMFYTAALGVALAYLGVPCPRQIHDWYLLKILFYLGAAGAYFGIGMRLHLGQIREHLRSHAVLFATKFLAAPVLTVAILWFASHCGLTPPPALMVQSLILLGFMPTAIQTVILSNLFHLDARMASSLWLVNTLAFFLIPLPAMMLLAGRL